MQTKYSMRYMQQHKHDLRILFTTAYYTPKFNADVNNINGVQVSSIEQTVVDSICDMEKIGGLEETIRCILLMPSKLYILDIIIFYI